MVIDAHMHVDDIPALGWKLEAEDCVRRLDEAGIDGGVVMTIVDAPEVNPPVHPGRLEAFARIHPWYGDEAAASSAPSPSTASRAQAQPGDDDRPSEQRGLAPPHPHGRGALGADPLPLRDEPLTTPLAIARAAGACPRRRSSSGTWAACSLRIEVEKVRLAGLESADERLVLGENARRLLDAVS